MKCKWEGMSNIVNVYMAAYSIKGERDFLILLTYGIPGVKPVLN